MGPEISFKSFTRYPITHKKIMDAALLQNIKFSSPPALLWGVVGENGLPPPDFSQRCWPVNVPKFRFKCLCPIDNYKPQPHDLTLGQRSHFKTRAAAADSHPSSVHRVSESGESCNRQWPHLQTDNLYTDGKTWQGNHRSQGQTDQGRKQPLPFLVK